MDLVRMVCNTTVVLDFGKVIAVGPTAKVLSDPGVINGRIAVVHEGGYCESYVPFCGHALVEQLADITTKVVDPLLKFARLQPPNPAFQAFQRDSLRQQIVLQHCQAFNVLQPASIAITTAPVASRPVW